MKVIIVGGGIGGLTTALSLREAGIETLVFEAAPRVDALGLGINLQPNAVRELTELGLAAKLAEDGGKAVEESGLPSEAEQTLQHIEQTGSRPSGYQGGGTFANDGRGGGEVLPRTGADGNPITYKEYDIHPYQKGVNRGAERVVIGSDGSAFYTSDHYGTFTRMR